jgi:hypothetical protein
MCVCIYIYVCVCVRAHGIMQKNAVSVENPSVWKSTICFS